MEGGGGARLRQKTHPLCFDPLPEFRQSGRDEPLRGQLCMFSDRAWLVGRLRLPQRLVEIGTQVFKILEPHGQTN